MCMQQKFPGHVMQSVTCLAADPGVASSIRALDHPILGPKFGPIPNAKKYIFFPIPDKKNPNLTLKKKQINFCRGSPSLFHIR